MAPMVRILKIRILIRKSLYAHISEMRFPHGARGVPAEGAPRRCAPTGDASRLTQLFPESTFPLFFLNSEESFDRRGTTRGRAGSCEDSTVSY